MAIKWKTSAAYIIACATEYYEQKLDLLRAGKLSLPIWQEMCLLNNIDTLASYQLARTDKRVRAIGLAIHNLQEVVLMKMLTSGRVSPTGIAVFLKAQHGWREGNEADQFGNNAKAQSVNDFLYNVGQMLQTPAPTRVNPFDADKATDRAKLTAQTNKG